MAKDSNLDSKKESLSLARYFNENQLNALNRSATYPDRNFNKILSNSDLNIIRKSKSNIDLKTLPIPRGSSPYALAKRAEYEEKNLYKAEMLYKQAIIKGERVESALKDLASVLQQQGKTQDACELLKIHFESILSDPTKFENLLINLEKQVVPSGNCLNKHLRISGLSQHTTKQNIRKLFKNSSRILDIVIHLGIDNESIVRYAILKLPSHSTARKTLESFHHWDRYRIEWVSINGEILGDVSSPRQPRQDRSKLLVPLFCCALFARDPENLSFTLPIDKSFHIIDETYEADIPEFLIGNSLSQLISLDFEFSASARCYLSD